MGSSPSAPIDSACRVLLVDDEPAVVSALGLLLQALGHTATQFNDPLAAVETLNEQMPIDLMLCDLKMPGMNGIETLKVVQERCPAIPFVLMSAHATSKDVEEAQAHGAVGFLSKPFTPDQLRRMVADVQAGRLEGFKSW